MDLNWQVKLADKEDGHAVRANYCLQRLFQPLPKLLQKAKLRQKVEMVNSERQLKGP